MRPACASIEVGGAFAIFALFTYIITTLTDKCCQTSRLASRAYMFILSFVVSTIVFGWERELATYAAVR